jgi:hypothetical protein
VPRRHLTSQRSSNHGACATRRPEDPLGNEPSEANEEFQRCPRSGVLLDRGDGAWRRRVPRSVASPGDSAGRRPGAVVDRVRGRDNRVRRLLPPRRPAGAFECRCRAARRLRPQRRRPEDAERPVRQGTASKVTFAVEPGAYRQICRVHGVEPPTMLGPSRPRTRSTTFSRGAFDAPGPHRGTAVYGGDRLPARADAQRSGPSERCDRRTSALHDVVHF